MRLRSKIAGMVLLSVSAGFAELTLPTIFTDHMVLQREEKVPVWGKADPNVVVTVEFAEQMKTAGFDPETDFLSFLSGAHWIHDANRMTFHRIKYFRKQTMKDSVPINLNLSPDETYTTPAN